MSEISNPPPPPTVQLYSELQAAVLQLSREWIGREHLGSERRKKSKGRNKSPSVPRKSWFTIIEVEFQLFASLSTMRPLANYMFT